MSIRIPVQWWWRANLGRLVVDNLNHGVLAFLWLEVVAALPGIGRLVLELRMRVSKLIDVRERNKPFQ